MSRTVPSFAEEGLKRFLHGMDRRIKDLERRGDWWFDEEFSAADTVTATACPTMGAASTISAVDHDGFPGFVISAAGTYVAAWTMGTTHASLDKDVVVARSTDQGASWSSTSTVLANNATYSYSNPSLALLTDGTLLLIVARLVVAGGPSAATGQVVALRSTDGGVTWSAPVTVTSGFTEYDREGFPLQLDDGSILCATYGENTGDSYTSTKVSRSTDGGLSWSALTTVADGQADSRPYNEAGLVRFGSVIVAIIRADTTGPSGGTYWRAASTDDGASWSAPVQVLAQAGGFPKPCTRRNGDIVVAYRDMDATGLPTTIARSSDRGLTWIDCHTFGSLAGQMTYAQVAEDPDGDKLAIVYADEDEAGGTSAVYFSRETSSTGGGGAASPTGTAVAVSYNNTDSGLDSTHVQGAVDELAIDADALQAQVDGLLTAPPPSTETVFAPTYTVTDAATLDLAITFVWGIDAGGDAYYNSAGVTAGEEAVLVLDNTTGELSLRPVEV